MVKLYIYITIYVCIFIVSRYSYCPESYQSFTTIKVVSGKYKFIEIKKVVSLF